VRTGDERKEGTSIVERGEKAEIAKEERRVDITNRAVGFAEARAGGEERLPQLLLE
jgi:hypothetical protein